MQGAREGGMGRGEEQTKGIWVRKQKTVVVAGQVLGASVRENGQVQKGRGRWQEEDKRVRDTERSVQKEQWEQGEGSREQVRSFSLGGSLFGLLPHIPCNISPTLSPHTIVSIWHPWP